MKIILISFSLLFLFLFGKQNLETSKIHRNSMGKEKDIAIEKTDNSVLQSKDFGITWQNISTGLPDSLQTDWLVANERDMFAKSGNEIFYTSSNENLPTWEKDKNLKKHHNLVILKSGIVAFNRNGQFIKKENNQDIWQPVFKTFQNNSVQTTYETAEGKIFIGTEDGLFRSADRGISWKHVNKAGWINKIVESDGVLLTTNQQGILRSADAGNTWELVISEGGVGIDVTAINGGFAAITYNTESETRRVRTSYDCGKSWNAIDTGLPADNLISSIVQAGEYLFCGHPKGIYRSADKGKTWKMMLPTFDLDMGYFNKNASKKVFNLIKSDNVIYALSKNGGC